MCHRGALGIAAMGVREKCEKGDGSSGESSISNVRAEIRARHFATATFRASNPA
jgi:hypothetical protein